MGLLKRFNAETSERLKYLLGSLLLLLMVYPFLLEGTIQLLALELVHAAVIVTSIYAVSYDKRHFFAGIVLGIITLGLMGMYLFADSSFALAVQISQAFFYLYIIFGILTYVIREKKVSGGLIYGAVSVYLLIGIAFASMYSAVEVFLPGSFIVEVGALGWYDFLYYSFTTLTTLGYGDITPFSAYARSLSILESSMGVMYIAVFIARVLGMYAQQVSTK